MAIFGSRRGPVAGRDAPKRLARRGIRQPASQRGDWAALCRLDRRSSQDDRRLGLGAVKRNRLRSLTFTFERAQLGGRTTILLDGTWRA